MLKEIHSLAKTEAFLWPDTYQKGRLPTVFFDPLYVLRASLHREDIILCHDVGPISHTELFDPKTCNNYKAAYEKIKKVKPGVVFVSESSKLEFQKYYGEDFRFLHAIPLYARLSARKGITSPIDGVTPPFFLTVAALEPRKNYLRVMEAYAQTGLHAKGIKYVFCGPRGYEANKILAAAAATPGVVALAYVSEPQLRWLYAKASGFVLPSLLEGFGVPALEAADAGLIPLVSKGGAQEEAIGGFGVLVDPMSVESIASGLTTLVSIKDDDRKVLIANAREHAKSLTLDRFLRGWERILKDNGPYPPPLPAPIVVLRQRQQIPELT
jgi:glycosyltransferase involved in cell wall biosynthesis